jgi:uncharacterized protein YjbI with pentapeptide repeats
MVVEDIKAIATVVAIKAESVLGRRAARVLGVLILFAVVIGTLLAFLDWYIAPSGADQKQALVVTTAQILGGSALLSGLYFTWRTLQVNREGQITDRFTRAIDQLGKVEDGQKLFEIRVGGIYALERIARESEEDYWPIMEILTAYVRQNARLPSEAGQERTQDATDEQRAMEKPRGKSEITELSAPDPDIQAIMTILRRRKRYYMHEEPEPLDLSQTNLTEANLTGAYLTEAILSDAILHIADLSGANLSEANLYVADLSRANLSEANLSDAILHIADLSGADLSEAGLSGAGLSGANLSGAYLPEANLSEAYLSGADFYGADLYRANLTEANLSEASLSEANLSEANLTGAHLSGADLSGAKNLIQEQLDQAEGDENTRLPPDLKPPAHWNVKTAEQPEED